MSDFLEFLAGLAGLSVCLFLIFCLVYFGLPIFDWLCTSLCNEFNEVFPYFKDWWIERA